MHPVTIGLHRAGAQPHHKFIHPTPADGHIIQAQHIPYLGGSFGADFQVRAYIYNPAVRYKQLVKGTFTYDTIPQVQPLNTGNLHPTNFQEDGNANGIYGVRGRNVPHLSVYRRAVDPQGNACDLFIGDDTPSDNLMCASGTTVRIDLTFEGQLVDVNPPHFVYVHRYWYVRGTYVKP